MQATDTAVGKSATYQRIAVAILAMVLFGFSFTYWMPVMEGTSFPTLIHVHALLWFGWFGLLVIQAALIPRDNVALHQRVGIAASVYTVLLIVVSAMLNAMMVARSASLITGGFESVPTIIPTTQILMFTVFFGLAFFKRRQADMHKRFIILAALVGMTPSFARVSIGLLGAPHVPLLFVVSNLVVIAVAVFDWRKQGRLHRVYLWGGLAIILVRLVRIPLAMSPIWKWYAELVADLLG